MNAEKALFEAYQEWRRLAKAESKAINLEDWNLLAECQNLLQNIQPVITRLTHEAQDEWEKSGLNFEVKKTKHREVVAGLIEIARKNQLLLRTARELAVAKGRQLEEAGRNLKRLQNSYAPAQPAGWMSFS
jgi:hypothetical protein